MTTAGEAGVGSCSAVVVVAGLLDPVTFTTTKTNTISTTTPMETKARVEGENRRGGGAVIFMFCRGARPLAPPPWGRPDPEPG